MAKNSQNKQENTELSEKYTLAVDLQSFLCPDYRPMFQVGSNANMYFIGCNVNWDSSTQKGVGINHG